MPQTLSLPALEELNSVAFIENAYRNILLREADLGGMKHYLTQLHNGKLRKFDIIVNLRLSSEGRKRAVPIENFWLKAILSIIRQIPVLGWLVFLPLDLLRLPFILRPLQAELACLQTQIEEIRQKAKCVSLDTEGKIADMENSLSRTVESVENIVEILECFKKDIDGHKGEKNTFLEKIYHRVSMYLQRLKTKLWI